MNYSHRILDEVKTFIAFIAVIWIVFFFDSALPLEQYGLIPRSTEGLIGIVTMPFLHGNFSHIVNNTPTLFVLLLLLAGSRANSKSIVLFIMLLGGLLLWLFGRGNAIHIGASNLIFGLIVFLIASGFFEKRPLSILISIIVFVLYGSSLITGIFPTQKEISWDGHLWGGVAGGLTAWGLLSHK